MENHHNKKATKEKESPNILLIKLNNKRPFSSLYRYKTNELLPFLSKNSPIQPYYLNKQFLNFNDKRLRFASMSTKDSEKDTSLKKIKQNKTYKIFNTLKQTISHIHNDILYQYKSKSLEKSFKTNQIKEYVNVLTSNLMKSNEEFDMTKETTCLIKTNSLQLFNDCHRILLENEELEYEVSKLKEENENVIVYIKNNILD